MPFAYLEKSKHFYMRYAFWLFLSKEPFHQWCATRLPTRPPVINALFMLTVMLPTCSSMWTSFEQRVVAKQSEFGGSWRARVDTIFKGSGKQTRGAEFIGQPYYPLVDLLLCQRSGHIAANDLSQEAEGFSVSELAPPREQGHVFGVWRGLIHQFGFVWQFV